MRASGTFVKIGDEVQLRMRNDAVLGAIYADYAGEVYPDPTSVPLWSGILGQPEQSYPKWGRELKLRGRGLFSQFTKGDITIPFQTEISDLLAWETLLDKVGVPRREHLPSDTG